jgi:hypothetical protein
MRTAEPNQDPLDQRGRRFVRSLRSKTPRYGTSFVLDDGKWFVVFGGACRHF